MSSTHPSPYLWQQDAQGWTLVLQGDWRGWTPEPADQNLHHTALSHTALVLEAQGLTHWDAGMAPALWTLLAPLAKRQIEIDTSSLPEAVRASIDLAWQATQAPDQPTTNTNSLGALEKLSLWIGQALSWMQAKLTVTFIGEVCITLGQWLRGRAIYRGSDVLHHMDHMGPRSLPIVCLTTFLVGLMLAYMGGAQLDRIGAENYIADLVTVGVVRELAALMTGVILTGRVGAAIAAELGTMVVNEEIDAFKTMGLEPVAFLVLPRLLAMLLVAPLVVALAMVVGVLAGLPVASGLYGVPPYEYLNQCLKALTWTHLWIGLFKGTMYCGLLVLAGCREGLYAGHNAQAVGLATTRAVVKALVWIVVGASASTAVLQSLGF
jgi:phospholipid/cholesterol/gamma-HCH transport system permease protein